MRDDNWLPNQDVIDLFENRPNDEHDSGNLSYDPLREFVKRRGE